jgi:mitochondrial enoyl-[acyl-carrier protein] reductase / trans-2-enoyl-CoA reductase
MVINPPTALQLLEEFVRLNPGDTVIQTGATSSVGKYVIQLCRQRDVHTINIIRDRPNKDETISELKDLGATAVVTTDEMRGFMREWPHAEPRLALDCIGGEAATEAAKALEYVFLLFFLYMLVMVMG